MVSLKEMARLGAERAPPTWLHTLLKTWFFDACPEYPTSNQLQLCLHSLCRPCPLL